MRRTNRYIDIMDTYDEYSDRYIDSYIREQRKDFDHQWNVYLSDDTISYEQREILKELMG